MALDVTTICKKYDTDKNKGEFPNSKMYDKLFAPLRDKPISLLEIGINRGGSVRLWEEYFSEASLYAIDVRRRCMQEASNRTTVDMVDQSDGAALRAYAEKRGDFDIIIDDGSHMTGHQILTFETLWPHLTPGGIYVVEDTKTSYNWKFVNSEMTAVEYFQSMVHEVNMPIGKRPAGTRDIDTMIFKQDTIVVTKS